MNRLGEWNLRLGLRGGRLIEDDRATPVALPQLNIGVQQLDATDRAIGSQVHIDRVAHPNGLHLGGLGMETDVGNVVSRIVGQFHGSVSPPRLIVPRHNRKHKPVFTFTDGECFNFLRRIMLTAPARVEPKISPKAGAAELGRERLARLNGCHNLILSNTTFRKPLQGMWVQPNHMPVETPAGGDSSSGRANRKRYRGEATGRACLPLPRSRAFWLWTKAEKALAHGRDRGIPRPLPKESA